MSTTPPHTAREQPRPWRHTRESAKHWKTYRKANMSRALPPRPGRKPGPLPTKKKNHKMLQIPLCGGDYLRLLELIQTKKPSLSHARAARANPENRGSSGPRACRVPFLARGVSVSRAFSCVFSRGLGLSGAAVGVAMGVGVAVGVAVGALWGFCGGSLGLLWGALWGCCGGSGAAVGFWGCRRGFWGCSGGFGAVVGALVGASGAVVGASGAVVVGVAAAAVGVAVAVGDCCGCCGG